MILEAEELHSAAFFRDILVCLLVVSLWNRAEGYNLSFQAKAHLGLVTANQKPTRRGLKEWSVNLCPA